MRELKNVIHRAFLMADGVIEATCLPAELTASEPAGEGLVRITATTSLAEAQRRLVLAALEHFDGDRRKVAAALGVSVRTLYNRLKEYGAGK